MGIYDGLLRVYRNLRLVHMNLRLVHMNLRLVHMNALCFSSIIFLIFKIIIPPSFNVYILLQRKCVVLSPFMYVIAIIPFYSLTMILARIRAIGPAGRRGEWTEVRSHHRYFKCSSLVLLLVVVIWSLVYFFVSTKLWFLIDWTLRKICVPTQATFPFQTSLSPITL